MKPLSMYLIISLAFYLTHYRDTCPACRQCFSVKILSSSEILEDNGIPLISISVTDEDSLLSDVPLNLSPGLPMSAQYKLF